MDGFELMGEVSGEREVGQGLNRDYREEKLKLRVICGIVYKLSTVETSKTCTYMMLKHLLFHSLSFFVSLCSIFQK